MRLQDESKRVAGFFGETENKQECDDAEGEHEPHTVDASQYTGDESAVSDSSPLQRNYQSPILKRRSMLSNDQMQQTHDQHPLARFIKKF